MARPTTKPKTVSRRVLTASGYINSEMQVMSVDQRVTTVKGTIILGNTEPCMRMKKGHLECLDMSRGPTFASQSGSQCQQDGRNVQNSPRHPASERYVYAREVDMSLRVLSKSEEKGVLAHRRGLCYSSREFQYRSA
jgi:hypothetical protein